MIKLGDHVKLLEPYRPEEYIYMNSKDWVGFEYGIVVEIVSHEYDRDLRQPRPRNVSLHLFDRLGKLYLTGFRDGVPLPTFVDFHISELLIYTDNMVEQI